MIKTIKVGDKEIKLKSSAAIPRIYRLKYKRDIFADMAEIGKALKANKDVFKSDLDKLDEDESFEVGCDIASNIPPEMLTIFENIAFLMNKHGDPNQPDDINDWIDQFETFDIYEIMPQIMQMWFDENKSTSVVKKKTVK